MDKVHPSEVKDWMQLPADWSPNTHAAQLALCHSEKEDKIIPLHRPKKHRRITCDMTLKVPPPAPPPLIPEAMAAMYPPLGDLKYNWRDFAYTYP